MDTQKVVYVYYGILFSIKKEGNSDKKKKKKHILSPSTRWGHSEKTTIYKPGNGLSPDMESASTLTLDFPASRTVRNKCFLFNSAHPIYDIFYYSSLNGLRHGSCCLMDKKFQFCKMKSVLEQNIHNII